MVSTVPVGPMAGPSRCIATKSRAGSGNKVTLSTAGVKAVAAHLRPLGVKDTLAVKGNGRAGTSAARANRINVMITFPTR